MNTIQRILHNNKLMLAPLAGFTDSPYRKIVRKHGAGLTVTELISAEGLVRRGEKTLEMLRFGEDERPIGIQIFGKDPQHMADAAVVAEEYKPDLIDINLGCPARKVCKSGSGAALLQDPELIYTIASGIKKVISLPLTAKIRIGWDEYSKNYIEVLRALEEAGIELLFVHGRTRTQAYSGKADWNVIAEINKAAIIPVVGNGDIASYEEAQRRLKESCCAGVMIGRGAVGNPWIFSGHKPDAHELYAQIKEHLDAMIGFYGDKGLVLMRKHLVKYIHGMRDASKIRKKIVITRDRNEVLDLLKSIIY